MGTLTVSTLIHRLQSFNKQLREEPSGGEIVYVRLSNGEFDSVTGVHINEDGVIVIEVESPPL